MRSCYLHQGFWMKTNEMQVSVSTTLSVAMSNKKFNNHLHASQSCPVNDQEISKDCLPKCNLVRMNISEFHPQRETFIPFLHLSLFTKNNTKVRMYVTHWFPVNIKYNNGSNQNTAGIHNLFSCLKWHTQLGHAMLDCWESFKSYKLKKTPVQAEKQAKKTFRGKKIMKIQQHSNSVVRHNTWILSSAMQQISVSRQFRLENTKRQKQPNMSMALNTNM